MDIVDTEDALPRGDIGRQVVEEESPRVDQTERGHSHGQRVGGDHEPVDTQVDVINGVERGLSQTGLVVKSRTLHPEIPAGKTPHAGSPLLSSEGVGEKSEIVMPQAVTADVDVGTVDGDAADVDLLLPQAETVETCRQPRSRHQGLATGLL